MFEAETHLAARFPFSLSGPACVLPFVAAIWGNRHWKCEAGLAEISLRASQYVCDSCTLERGKPMTALVRMMPKSVRSVRQARRGRVVGLSAMLRAKIPGQATQEGSEE
ncbi:hypothetical protein [Bradyrhizobium sp. AS23.2]|uniref:hypothetical protein n=1 Tax=Bradyrhizobium sp. AS23.2 TaxID=1680155 RepID=UPI001161506F|nr:hypothetical protein [Bradyrhizobium sp. AS23.2]